MRVVFVVGQTGNVGYGALLGRDPQIGGPRIEDDREGLTRSTDTDFSVILGIHVVSQVFRLRGHKLLSGRSRERLADLMHLCQFISGLGQSLPNTFLFLQLKGKRLWLQTRLDLEGKSQATKTKSKKSF